ncbi:DNA methyltransferase [Nonomuraea muscovyensis]|uniref:Eco57I restriction-modification methylase domain-containing protein n=1 Tax=Nonomuraea muscovyensis TaxID=1124761 RepID=UPI0033E29CF7
MTSALAEPRIVESPSAIRIEGRLFTADLLARLATGDRELPGCTPADYGLYRGERVGDAAGRAWAALLGAYRAFRDDLVKYPGTGKATALTRKAWLLRIFSELGYGPLDTTGATVSVPGRDEVLQASHIWQKHLPVHLLAWGVSLDHKAGNRRAPQSMLQELLNSSPDHAWGVLSNGQVLRVLRDSTALVGSAYLEFDLEAIFEHDQYADFVLFYSLLHASRFELVAKPRKRRRGKADDGEEASDEEATAETGDEDADQLAQRTLDAAADPDAPPLTPLDCRIEWLRTHSIETGLRARDHLRDQVANALGILGTGFLEVNRELRDRIAAGGQEALEDFHHELLRLAYQLIFLFVVEDRRILLDASDTPETKAARQRYRKYFSTSRLRQIAFRRRGDRNTDLWPGLCHVLDALGSDGGLPALALPELGGLYFRGDEQSAAATRLGSAEPLRKATLANDRLLEAVQLLCQVQDDRRRMQKVDYQHLGSEELGSVYESLLELRPRRTAAPERFWLQTLSGNKRKTTGAYYTPSTLIDKLLDEALDPVINLHAASGDPRDLLRIRFVDPACGSGHVLVAAARRIAHRYAEMETGDPEPAPERVRAALAEVVRHCVHGVDISPMAVEIAKVSLWLESLEPGRPLAYLDDRVKVGNALLGTTPALIAGGLPDGAFKKLAGDDSKLLASLKATNKKERAGGDGTQAPLPGDVSYVSTSKLRAEAEALAALPDDSLAKVREQARRYEQFIKESEERQRLQRVADAWCAAFLWPKNAEAPPAITTGVLLQLADGERLPGSAGEQMLANIAGRNQFFHWHLEFPRVFRVENDMAPDHNPDTGWQGGFDCVLGNPPWERVKIQEKEWFATRDETIADAANAHERKSLIAALETSEDSIDRALYDLFQVSLREAAGTTLMLRNSGIFPLTGHGDVNTYAVFAERARMLLAPAGRAGLVVPTGIATDLTTSRYFGDLVERRQLVSVLDMENEEKLFPDVTNRYSFCLFTISGPAEQHEQARLAFRARRPDQLDARTFRLDAAGFRAINPNTCTSPVCDSPEHLDILRRIHERLPVLWERRNGPRDASNHWRLRFLRMFDMASDSKRFLAEEKLDHADWSRNGTVFSRRPEVGAAAAGIERALPLYEGKFIHHFDARFATYENATEAQINKGTLPRLDMATHENPTTLPVPRYWVPEEYVEDRLAVDAPRSVPTWPHNWLMAWRDVCRGSDERTVIASVIPRTAVGHTAPLLLPLHDQMPLSGLLANLCSFVLDFTARQKISGAHLTYAYLEQLPMLTPRDYEQRTPWHTTEPLSAWIRDRVLELTYTSHEIAPFARYLNDEGPPFVWDEGRRFLMRAELDAAYFHLYGLVEAEVELVLNSFRAFRNKKPELFERTKEEILDIYRQMKEASAQEAMYVHPRLDPAPGKGRRHKPGTSPFNREKPKPAAPQRESEAREPTEAGNALFGLRELGLDEQLGIWG